MPSDDLSIIMPVCNERAIVWAAIVDALGPELPIDRRELIVVDDGSTVGTRNFLFGEEWPENVTVLCLDRNRGRAAAIRTVLRRGSGDFSATLDAGLDFRATDLGAIFESLVSGEANVGALRSGFTGTLLERTGCSTFRVVVRSLHADRRTQDDFRREAANVGFKIAIVPGKRYTEVPADVQPGSAS